MRQVPAISAAFRTDTGLVRGHNEDFVAAFEPNTSADQMRHGWLYIVADGVGGADAGEVASQYAAERAIHHYLSADGTEPVPNRLLESMQLANTDLRALAAERNDRRRMATTMVAAAIHGDRLTIGNVGDSRAYLHRGTVIEQVTKDQSLVAKLVEEGAITPEEASTHPHRNIILTSIGSEKRPPIDLYERQLLAGDLLLLCSDGLTRHLTDGELAELLGRFEPDVAAAELVELARQRGGEDNISVVIVRYEPRVADEPVGEPVSAIESAEAAPQPAIGEAAEPAIAVVAQPTATEAHSLLPLALLLATIMVALILLIWFIIQRTMSV